MLRVLGLDISAKNTGFALLVDGKLEAHGNEARLQGESDREFACRTHWNTLRLLHGPQPVHVVHIVYEVQRGPIPAKRRKALEWCIQQRGRLLQALGVEGHPVEADRRPKKRRREEMEMIYGMKLNEHAADALAVAHTWYHKEKVRRLADGVDT